MFSLRNYHWDNYWKKGKTTKSKDWVEQNWAECPVLARRLVIFCLPLIPWNPQKNRTCSRRGKRLSEAFRATKNNEKQTGKSEVHWRAVGGGQRPTTDRGVVVLAVIEVDQLFVGRCRPAGPDWSTSWTYHAYVRHYPVTAHLTNTPRPLAISR